MFEDTILLKIKRDFTESEAVSFLKKELADAKFKNGELLSELQEKKFEYAQLFNKHQLLLKQSLKPKIVLSKKDLQEDRFNNMQSQNTANVKKIKRLMSDVELWRSKWLNQIAKK